MKRNLEQRVEVLVPIDETELRAELREIIDTIMDRQYGIWQMNGDGSYTQLEGKNEDGMTSQLAMVEQAHERLRRAKKQKKRKPSKVRRRNIRYR